MPNKKSYTLETATSPILMFLVNEGPQAAKILAGFHKLLGFKESFITAGDGFTLHIEKGSTVTDAILEAKEALSDPDFTFPSPEDEALARLHIPALAAGIVVPKKK
jgi:hypothetical protein